MIRLVFRILTSVACFCSLITANATPRQGKVRIVVSVDWEGMDLSAHNLSAMRQFRQDYPDIPLQHFLNAAYYTKPRANPERITQAINSVLLPADEHALHIHGWRSLFEKAGVSFKTRPVFVGEEVDPSQCRYDCGHEVPITAYSQSELRQVIRFSNDLLEAHGFKRPKSFRAGGWQANQAVLEALAMEGFTLDSSAVYRQFLEPAWGGSNLLRFLRRLWPTTLPTSQPYRIKLGEQLAIAELPNNGCLADYMTGEQMLAVFTDNARALKDQPRRDVFVSIGFHQETAADYLPALREGIDAIKRYAQAQDISYEFTVDLKALD